MIWHKRELESESVRGLAARHDLSLLEASILLRRGIVEGDSLLAVLEDDLRFAVNPFLFRGMEDVIDRIAGAKDDQERVLVYGDRDADGITSTVLVVEALRAYGIQPEWKVPLGDDAYGLTLDVVQEFAAGGGGLIITIDCGISNTAEVGAAQDLGIDVLILDHHVAPPELPPALAIVNPKVLGETYPFAHLAACSVAAKVTWALRFSQTPLFNQRMCLLHCRATEDGLLVEASRLVNLTERKRLSILFTAATSAESVGTLVNFLQDQELFVFDEALQLRLLRQIFGRGVDIALFDLAPQIRTVFPQLRALSFEELKASSRLPRYRAETGDLDILFSLFVSSVYKASPSLSTDFLPVLDLVAMGTLADLMPLEGENRILVRLGIQALQETKREGLRSLLIQLKLLGKNLSASDVGWSLTPVINAAGRLGHPDKAVELLLTDDPERRRTLARELDELNRRRRELGAAAWDDLLPAARKSFEDLSQKMVFVVSEKVPRGITGLVASRLMSSFGVPAAVVTVQAERCIGSLRTNRGFETRRFLDAFSDLFTDYGGHDQAAGFHFPAAKRQEFEIRLKALLPDFPLGEEVSGLEIDAELPLEFLTPELYQMVDRFEPYGEGWRPLIFTARRLLISELDLVGKTGAAHVKLTLDSGRHKWPSIFWNALDRLERGDFAKGDLVDAAFHVGRNIFQGQARPQLTILDLVRSSS